MKEDGKRVRKSDLEDLRGDLSTIYGEPPSPDTYLVRRYGRRVELISNPAFSPPGRTSFIMERLGYILHIEQVSQTPEAKTA